MKIFVAYGYKEPERTRWIEDYVFPIIEALGGKVITGKRLQGLQHGDEIARLIEDADGFIAFLTKRGRPARGVWRTHEYVVSELGKAAGAGRRFVQVRETGVDPQMNLSYGRQFIEYDDKKRERCLVEIVQTVARWAKELSTIQILLLPSDFQTAVRKHLDKELGVQCTYAVMHYGKLSPEAEQSAKVLPLAGNLAIQIPVVPPDSLIRVRVAAAGATWTCDYTSVDKRIVTLEKSGE
jgi:hypothetical protein